MNETFPAVLAPYETATETKFRYKFDPVVLGDVREGGGVIVDAVTVVITVEPAYGDSRPFVEVVAVGYHLTTKGQVDKRIAHGNVYPPDRWEWEPPFVADALARMGLTTIDVDR